MIAFSGPLGERGAQEKNRKTNFNCSFVTEKCMLLVLKKIL